LVFDQFLSFLAEYSMKPNGSSGLRSPDHQLVSISHIWTHELELQAHFPEGSVTIAELGQINEPDKYKVPDTKRPYRSNR